MYFVKRFNFNMIQEEGSRVATETVPEEEEEYEEEKSSDSNALDSATEAPDKEVKQLKLDEDDAPISTSNSKPVTPILAKKNARVPKSPKSPRSPMSPRYLKLFARSAVPVDTEVYLTLDISYCIFVLFIELVESNNKYELLNICMFLVEPY